MSVEENKAIAGRWFEALTSLEGTEKAADELLVPDFVGHVPPFPDVHGPEGYKQFIAGTFQAYPDARFDVEDVIAEGDMVAARVTMRGTHQGEFRGIAPTGNKLDITGIGIFSFSDGKVVESWDNFDQLGMMRQLGAIPSPEQATG